jgi:hypothetical protein
MYKARYLKVEAQVRYWEDATINGENDEDGDNVPFKSGDIWAPIVDIENGVIVDWPIGVVANIHFKVCDAGECFLLDEDKNKIAKYNNYYVPDEFLCHGDDGYGDYIILDICESGKIKNYRKPSIDEELWDEIK